jgi:catechol 2,3-dioxygenase-like lactoylglutathione lyase family enzyme
VITNVKIVGVNVADQERALRFYVDKLGFENVTDQPMGDGPNSRWIEVLPPDGQTRLVLWTPPGHEDRVGTFAGVVFTCEDVQGTYEELRDRGVEFTAEPKAESWGVAAQFKDSEGNTFVLSSQT